jgi:hypothetical protein
MKFILLLLVCSFPLLAQVEKTAHPETQQFYFKPERWLEGVHLFAGGGLNASIYNSAVERQNQGIGLNFKTDLGYYFNDRFAIEASSNVKFNKMKEYLIWDTLLTLGLRYRFEKFPFTKSKSIYGRVFYGVAPTVFFLDDAPQVYRRRNSARIQYDGPVVGLALGNMYETKSGRVWYVEYGASYQYLRNETGINNKGDTPVVAFNDKNGNSIRIYSLYATIGLLVF